MSNSSATTENDLIEEFWTNLQSNYELRLERRVRRDMITPLSTA